MPMTACEFLQKFSTNIMLMRNQFYTFLYSGGKISGKGIHFVQSSNEIFSVLIASVSVPVCIFSLFAFYLCMVFLFQKFLLNYLHDHRLSGG